MRYFKYIVPLLILFCSFNSLACELTDKYKETRMQAWKEAHRPYNNCINSISDAKYWHRVVQCKKAGDGKDIGGGCAHVVGLNTGKYNELKIDPKFCNELKVTVKEVGEYSEYLIKKNNIKKCK